MGRARGLSFPPFLRPSLANKSRFVCRAKVAFRVKVPREGGVHVGFLQTSLFQLGPSFDIPIFIAVVYAYVKANLVSSHEKDDV